MSNLNFSNLEAYRNWRTIWRENYRALSLDIRAHKLNLRTKQRKDGNEAAATLQSDLVTERNKARQMMDDRLEAKALAQSIWAKLHDVAAVAA